MAELGVAVLSSFLQVVFDRLASADIRHYFQKRGFNENLVKEMEIMLSSLNTVIDDAEYKQFTDSDVKAWLLELKDAAYDAEDVLDEVNYEAYKLKMEADADTQTGGVIAKVQKLFDSSASSFVQEIESRMKQVLETLEFLEARKMNLGLKEGVKRGALGSATQLQTTSLVDEAGVYGRNGDKDIIIKGLLKDSHFSVMSVVGMGGLGKTTLAQLVYNDPTIQSAFDLRVWVCVSDDFDVLRLTKQIFNKIEPSNHDTDNLDTLQTNLKDRLSGKKFLIVLDDVWCDDFMSWEALQKPFICGAAGSRILVTTRNKNVAAKAARSDEIYHPQNLSEEEGWLLFTKYAFRNSSTPTNFDTEEIGRRIVQKCKGLPLALKTIASLLYTESTWEEWNNILMSDIWNISSEKRLPPPALILSYHYLPSHLKQCFSYCSLFPKDYEFEKEELVLLWMAQDFLRDSQPNKLIEFGNECFQELVSRSFFQRSSANEARYVMHDILHDLAVFVSGELCFKQEVEEVQKIPDKTRHFSFVTNGYKEFILFQHLQKNRKVRTFLNIRLRPYPSYWTSSDLIFDQLSECKSLRVLTLDCHVGIRETPDFIRNLIHLRYLDLSRCEIKRLPDSVCLLYNLQTLKLAYCRFLYQLPAGLQNLNNLHQLHLQGTEVKKIPPNMVELKNLQIWPGRFYVRKRGEPNVKQLGELDLRGELSICELQNVVGGMDALKANLKEKKHLKELSFKWDENSNEDSQNERDVLENLQPHQNLKQLSVCYYGGTRFPDWFGDKTALVSIVSLRLDSCKYCFVLPSLGLLSSLKSLVIEGLDGIVDVGAEFLGSNSCVVPFKSLEILEFRKMKNWERWDCTTSSRAFLSLEQLQISDCPKLEKNLPQQLPSLKYLQISDCPGLASLIPGAPTIRRLSLRNCGKVQLEHMPSTLEKLKFYGPCMDEVLLGKIEHTIYNHSIEELEIGDCPDWELPLKQHHDSLRKISIRRCGSLRAFQLDPFPALQELCLVSCNNLEIISVSEGSNHVTTSLECLRIDNCPKFLSILEGGFSARNLKWCYLHDLENLKSLPERMNIFAPSLRDISIRNCPQLEPFPEGGLPSKLETLHIEACPKVFGSRKKWGLQNLGFLHWLIVWGDDVAESLPEPGLLPTSLTSLSIIECHKLKMLDYEGLSQLSSLKTLLLQDCPKLEYLPREGLPSSISKLEILGQNCKEIQRRCQQPTGEDWPKIAHIPWVEISPNHWVAKIFPAQEED